MGEFEMSSRAYTVSGMTCEHCVSAVTAEVGAVPGVSVVDVELEGGRLLVTPAPADDAAVLAAVVEAGFSAVPAEQGVAAD
jgi:copper chaperone CopZ